MKTKGENQSESPSAPTSGVDQAQLPYRLTPKEIEALRAESKASRRKIRERLKQTKNPEHRPVTGVSALDYGEGSSSSASFRES